MSYFKTSYATLQQLAMAGRFEDVAGFLVLARHASGLSIGGYEPYKLSGAGINSIHEKAGVSEETARGVMERLKARGVVKPVAPEVTKSFSHARWEVVQGALDLELPHAFTDNLKGSSAKSALRRLKDAAVRHGHADAFAGVSDSEVKLDALMVLLAVYANTQMEAFGGLNPRCAYRQWDIKSQVTKSPGIRWGAEPENEHSYFAFMGACLAHAAVKKELTKPQQTRFWNAWANVKETGLIYEAVALFDADPVASEQARLRVTLRVNDFHAGSATKEGDPSLLRTFETTSGSQLAYYTPAQNDREEPEAMWVILPDKRGALIGIWRPRFRAATKDVGVWIEKENEAIAALAQQLEPA